MVNENSQKKQVATTVKRWWRRDH